MIQLKFFFKHSYLIKNILLIFSLILKHNTTIAQDIHYTQFYADPLRLNPATTGAFNADYRIGLNARQQWKSVTTPYRTASTYAELGILSNSQQTNWAGVGLYLLHDDAGDGILTTNEIRTNIAVHQPIGQQVSISMGLNASFTQRNINTQKLYFGNQWNETGFETTIPNNESFEATNRSYFDVGAGLQLKAAITEIQNLNVGISVLHLNTPYFSFYAQKDSNNNRLGRRYTANVGTTILQNNYKIEPAIYFSTQKKASELVIGANLVRDLNNNQHQNPEDLKLYLGLWYRHKDAIAPLVGGEYQNYRLLFSYDITISQLGATAKNRGGLEISLVKIGTFRDRSHTKYDCPDFLY